MTRYRSKSIKNLVGDLVERPRGILCLDNCDLIDALKKFTEDKPNLNYIDHAKAFRRAIDELDRNPELFQVLITDLVLLEWDQNVEEKSREIDKFLVNLDTQIRLVWEASKAAGQALPDIPFEFESLQLTQRMVKLVENLLKRSFVIKEDFGCVKRALARVKEKQPPTQQGKEIKDSIIFEHYLELSRRLKEFGHTQPRIFVSQDKAFWESKNNSKIHPNLKTQAEEVGLLFISNLENAIRMFGI